MSLAVTVATSAEVVTGVLDAACELPLAETVEVTVAVAEAEPPAAAPEAVEDSV